MIKEYYSVDSIEENIVKLNSCSDSSLFDFIQLHDFEECPNEGDLVYLDNNSIWKIDKEQTKKKKKDIKSRFERLKIMKKRG